MRRSCLIHNEQVVLLNHSYVIENPSKDSQERHQAEKRMEETRGCAARNLGNVPTKLSNLNVTSMRKATRSKEVELGCSYQVKPEDVLCGARGNSFMRVSSRENESISNRQQGNVRFHTLVNAYLERYRAAKNRHEKSKIVKDIVDAVRENGGHFVRFHEGMWLDIGDAKAQEKTGSALRAALTAPSKTPHDKKSGTKSTRDSSVGTPSSQLSLSRSKNTPAINPSKLSTESKATIAIAASPNQKPASDRIKHLDSKGISKSCHSFMPANFDLHFLPPIAAAVSPQLTGLWQSYVQLPFQSAPGFEAQTMPFESSREVNYGDLSFSAATTTTTSTETVLLEPDAHMPPSQLRELPVCDLIDTASSSASSLSSMTETKSVSYYKNELSSSLRSSHSSSRDNNLRPNGDNARTTSSLSPWPWLQMQTTTTTALKDDDVVDHFISELSSPYENQNYPYSSDLETPQHFAHYPSNNALVMLHSFSHVPLPTSDQNDNDAIFFLSDTVEEQDGLFNFE